VAEEIFQRKPLASARPSRPHPSRTFTWTSNDRLGLVGPKLSRFRNNRGERRGDTEGFVNELLSIETVQIFGHSQRGETGTGRGGSLRKSCRLRRRPPWPRHLWWAAAIRMRRGCTFDGKSRRSGSDQFDTGDASMLGVLLIDKPLGCTSHDVVNDVPATPFIRSAWVMAGTLDPLATGLLVVAVGPCDALPPVSAPRAQGEYVAENLHLEKTTTTYDREGGKSSPRPRRLTIS